MNAGQAMSQFQFIISDDQYFEMSTHGSDYVGNMKIAGDQDNKLFFENTQFGSERQREAEPYLKIFRDSTVSPSKRKEAKDAYDRIGEQLVSYQNKLIATYPNTLTAKIIKAHQPVRVPDAPKRLDGSIDSTFRLKWYREHFFDNFDLSEPGLLCLPQPLYKKRIEEYLDNLYVPQADSITQAIDKIVFRAKKNQETYKYVIRQALFKYQQPEIMGLDEVFVNVYDKYVATGQMNFWLDTKTNKNLKEHADRLRRSLVGNLGAKVVQVFFYPLLV